jgi:hypothetical protein
MNTTLNKTAQAAKATHASIPVRTRLTERTARLLAAAGYFILAALPAVLLLKALSMTSPSHSLGRAFMASWANPFGGNAWAGAWIALFLWATPLLLKSVLFLISALNPKVGNPWDMPFPGWPVFDSLTRGQAMLLAAFLLALATAAAPVILVSNWASVEAAIRSFIAGAHGTPAGFAPLAWAFVTATIGLRMLGMAMSGNGNAGESEDEDEAARDEEDRQRSTAGPISIENDNQWTDRFLYR